MAEYLKWIWKKWMPKSGVIIRIHPFLSDLEKLQKAVKLPNQGNLQDSSVCLLKL